MREFVAVEAGTGPPTAVEAAPHLTLRFLGEVAAERNPEIAARLGPAVAAASRFAFRLEGVGAFPSARAPRVVWTGVTEGRAELLDLARRVRLALEPMFGADREEFVPHLTLFRVRSGVDRTAAEELLEGRRPAPPARTVMVREVVLKESILGPRGATHRTLAAFPLRIPAETGP